MAAGAPLSTREMDAADSPRCVERVASETVFLATVFFTEFDVGNFGGPSTGSSLPHILVGALTNVSLAVDSRERLGKRLRNP